MLESACRVAETTEVTRLQREGTNRFADPFSSAQQLATNYPKISDKNIQAVNHMLLVEAATNICAWMLPKVERCG
jgi:hypothetical protein